MIKDIVYFILGVALILLVPILYAPAHADNLVIGAGSWHSSSGYVRDSVYRDYNQFNLGIGYEAELSTRSYWVAGMYKDSHYGTTYYTGMMWFPGEYSHVKVGVAALLLHSKSYQLNAGLDMPLIPVILPVVELDVGLVKFNVSYVPKVSHNGDHVLGVQIKLPMENLI